tara:strand:- start:17583 stop:17759 length:177 start_codon:yes stop_codon:yes gene_type:complete
MAKEVIIMSILLSILSATTPPKKFIAIVPIPKTAAATPSKSSDPLISKTNFPAVKVNS